MKTKAMISSAAVVLLALLGYFLFFSGSSRKYEFRFDRITTGDINVQVTATGTINAVTSVEVGTQVSGIIAKLYADFNSIVKEGQIIAQIDPTFLQQSVKDAEANRDKTKAQFADAKRVYERTKALYEKSLESQANFDASLTAFETGSGEPRQSQNQSHLRNHTCTDQRGRDRQESERRADGCGQLLFPDALYHRQ
jgi:HlyD family secretion protein